MRSRRLLVAVVALGATFLGSTTTAFGASTPKSGTIFIAVTPNKTATYPIVVVGAIADSGSAITIDKDGKIDPNGNYVHIVLKNGSFEVNSTQLNKEANAAPPTMNNTTDCSFAFVTSGPVTLFNGTGAYAGISGTLKITESFVAILPTYTSGTHKGKCNESDSAQPVAENGSISGSGKVAF